MGCGAVSAWGCFPGTLGSAGFESPPTDDPNITEEVDFMIWLNGHSQRTGNMLGAGGGGPDQA